MPASITGWLNSTKSCSVEPGIRLTPGTPVSLIDMPRMSCSVSVSEVALANRMCPWNEPGVANSPTRRSAGSPSGTVNSARTQPVVRVWLKRRTGPSAGPRQARLLQERDEVGHDGLFVRRDDFFSKRQCHRGLPSLDGRRLIRRTPADRTPT